MPHPSNEQLHLIGSGTQNVQWKHRLRSAKESKKNVFSPGKEFDDTLTTMMKNKIAKTCENRHDDRRIIGTSGHRNPVMATFFFLWHFSQNQTHCLGGTAKAVCLWSAVFFSRVINVCKRLSQRARIQKWKKRKGDQNRSRLIPFNQSQHAFLLRSLSHTTVSHRIKQVSAQLRTKNSIDHIGLWNAGWSSFRTLPFLRFLRWSLVRSVRQGSIIWIASRNNVVGCRRSRRTSRTSQI